MMWKNKVSRRKFFKTATTTSVALPVISGVGPPIIASAPGNHSDAQPTGFDLTKRSAALEADNVVDSACQFCNSLCRLKVHLKEGRIIEVRGEPNDPVQAGGLCVKGQSMMTQLVYNRFRLTRPMKRVGGDKGSFESRFEPVSWNEAFDIIAKRFLALRDAGEARAIANKTSGRLPRGT